MSAGAAFPERLVPETARNAAVPGAVRLAKYAEIHSVGRRTGREHRTTVCFAWSQGAIYVLAHRRPDGRPGDWYSNIVSAGGGVVEIAGLRMRVLVAPGADTQLARQLVIALLRHKYGNQAVTAWQPSSGAIPVRMEVLAIDALAGIEAPMAAGSA